MNVNTGEIIDIPAFVENLKDQPSGLVDEFMKMLEGEPSVLVPVKEEDMTKKQKETKQVSLKDHRSKLGKKLTAERKLRRNEPCFCGSGIKFKKCCMK